MKQIQYLQEQLNILIAQQNSQTATPPPTPQQDSQIAIPQTSLQDVSHPATTSQFSDFFASQTITQSPTLPFVASTTSDSSPKSINETIYGYHKCDKSLNDKFAFNQIWCDKNGKGVYTNSTNAYPPAQP